MTSSSAPLGAPRLYAIPVLTGILGFVFLLGLVQGGTFWGSQADPFVVRAALDPGATFLRGQWWRIGTAPWLHLGATHLFLNVLFLIVIGAPVERTLGATRTFVLVAVAGPFALLVHAWAFPFQATLGVSGAVFALAAAAVVLSFKSNRGKARAVGGSVALVIVSLLAGYWISIDHAAHIAGAVAGVALTSAFHTKGRNRVFSAVILTAVLVGTLVFATRAVRQSPVRVGAAALLDAEEALDKQNLVLAQRQIDIALRALPLAPRALILRARIRHARGELDTALDDLRDAWRRNPRAEGPYQLASEMLADVGRSTEEKHVVDLWRKAIPESGLAFAAQAEFLRKKGDLVEAVIAVDRALARSNAPEVLFVAARCRAQIGDRDGALQLLKSAVGIGPVPKRDLALYALLDGRLREAETVYEIAAEEHPAATDRLLPFWIEAKRSAAAFRALRRDAGGDPR